MDGSLLGGRHGIAPQRSSLVLDLRRWPPPARADSIPAMRERALDVLIVSGDPWWGRVAAAVLHRAGHHALVAASLEPRLRVPRADAVLAYAGEGRSGAPMERLAALRRPVVVAIGDDDRWDAIAADAPRDAILVGAWDAFEQLVAAVEHAGRTHRPLRLVSSRRNRPTSGEGTAR